MNNLKITKVAENQFWHEHNGTVYSKFSISKFSISFDDQLFKIIENDGARRFSYNISNITLNVNGADETFSDVQVLLNRLIIIKYTGVYFLWNNSLNIPLNTSQLNNDGDGNSPFVTEDQVPAFNQDNIKKSVALTFPNGDRDYATPQQFLAVINSLTPFTISEKQILTFYSVASNGSIYFVEILNKGKGTYGEGSTQLTLSDIKLTVQKKSESLEFTESFDLDDSLNDNYLWITSDTSGSNCLIPIGLSKGFRVQGYVDANTFLTLIKNSEDSLVIRSKNGLVIPKYTTFTLYFNGVIDGSEYWTLDFEIPTAVSDGKITITDLQGQAFTDLASAVAWITPYYIGDFTADVADLSFKDSVFKLTLPQDSSLAGANGFCSSSTSSKDVLFKDSNGLVNAFARSCFVQSTQNNVIGKASFQRNCFQQASPTIKNIIAQVVSCEDSFGLNYKGRIDIGKLGNDKGQELPTDIFTTGELVCINVPYSEKFVFDGSPDGDLQQAKANMYNLNSVINYEGVDYTGFVYKTSAFTAENDKFYITQGSFTIDDSQQIEGKGYVVYVLRNSVVINTVTYGPGSLIYRFYNDGNWTSVLINKPTNLEYVASPTYGIVGNDNGDYAEISLADATNAGLLSPAGFTALSNSMQKSYKNSAFTAQNNFFYICSGTGYPIYDFSSPNIGDGYIVFVSRGSAISIGGATIQEGYLIYRFYTSVGWSQKEISNQVAINYLNQSSAKIPQQLKDFYSDVSNSGTSETDLYSFSTIANQLTGNGEKIIAVFGGTFNDTTASSQIKVKFAGVTIGNTGALTMSVVGAFIVNVSIMRTGTTTARAMVNISTPGASTAAYTKYTTLTGLDFTTTNILKITGQAGGIGGSGGDITATYGNILWQPASQ